MLAADSLGPRLGGGLAQAVHQPAEPRAGPFLLSKPAIRLAFEPFAIQKSQYSL